MCGICGFTGEIVNRNMDKQTVITRMADVITHRGPDDCGYHVEDDITMGFRRLSIIDLADGDQPMFNEDRSMVLTFNGEIYNFKELREELIAAGHTFANHSDSEVLLHGYEQWGTELVKRLRGMYAFVIYNKKDGSLFGARDIFGIKPFYYAQMNGSLLFGSEIKSFLEHPDFK